MTPLAILFVILNAVALFVLPRRWAPMPLLIGACYMTLGQGIRIGPFSFNVIRMLIFFAGVRVFCRREGIEGKLTTLDHVMLAWGIWSLCSSVFYGDVASALVYRLGVTYNFLGIYFLTRCFCRSIEDVVQFVRVTALLLVPVALEMLQEQITGRNLFSIFGEVSEAVMIRTGRLRAQGPFSHPILAGTVGAACIPLMVGIWRRSPKIAKCGMSACLTMVVACASSGPLVSTIFSAFALGMWRWRKHTGILRATALILYVICDMVMTRPAYFLIQKMDLTGSSTGWHRAKLIQQTIAHFDEWWLAGTNYTRHWMPTGVSWSPDHTDITNHYIANAVQGGLLLMLLFVCCMWVAFRNIGTIARTTGEGGDIRAFGWSLGASLFSYALSALSVAYFGQSFVFLYATFGIIGSLYATVIAADCTAIVATDVQNADMEAPNEFVFRAQTMCPPDAVIDTPDNTEASSEAGIASDQGVCRNNMVEAFRILAACGVIWFHIEGAPLRQLGYAGLVYFLIISSALQRKTSGADSRRYLLRRTVRLLLPWAAWFVAYGILNLIKGKSFVSTAQTPIEALLSGSWIGLWYLPFSLLAAIVRAGLATALSYCDFRRSFAIISGASIACILMITAVRTHCSLHAPWSQWLHASPTVFIGLLLAPVARGSEISKGVASCWLAVLLVTCAAISQFDPGVAISYGVGTVMAFIALNANSDAPAWVRSVSPLCFGVYLVHSALISGTKQIPWIGGTPLLVFISVTILSFVAAAVLRAIPVLKLVV